MHMKQSCPLKSKKTAKFMEEISAHTTTGNMSKIEYLLISAIIQHVYPGIEDWNDVDNSDPHVILNYFESVHKIVKCLNIQVPIFKRNLSEIETALKHYKSQFNVFYKLHT